MEQDSDSAVRSIGEWGRSQYGGNQSPITPLCVHWGDYTVRWFSKSYSIVQWKERRNLGWGQAKLSPSWFCPQLSGWLLANNFPFLGLTSPSVKMRWLHFPASKDLSSSNLQSLCCVLPCKRIFWDSCPLWGSIDLRILKSWLIYWIEENGKKVEATLFEGVVNLIDDEASLRRLFRQMESESIFCERVLYAWINLPDPTLILKGCCSYPCFMDKEVDAERDIRNCQSPYRDLSPAWILCF